MFSLTLFTVVLSCLVPSTFAAPPPPPDEFYFDQEVDHFGFHWQTYGKPTYRQRYLVHDASWLKGEGPIFFYTGNEGDIVDFWNNTGFMFDIAPQFRALVVFGEHRFYGKSIPFGNASFTHPYIDLLTAEQALADYSTLIGHIKLRLNATRCPVIAFGGSYGGMLSAYMRFRYPNVVVGSIASSAPILLAANESPREQFFEDVTSHFDAAATGCKEGVRQAFTTITHLFDSGSEGLRNVSATFGMCKTLARESYDQLIGWARNAFTTLATSDYPYPTNFLAPLPAHPVKEACRQLLAAANPLSGLAAITNLVYGGTKCHELDAEYIACADPTGCGLGTDSLGWDYQVCTEFTRPAGSNNLTDMFAPLPFTPQQRSEYCVQHWGVLPRPDWARISFWGRDIGAATNIVFSNGLLDPWARGGVLESVSDTVVAVIIEEGAHHLDIRDSNPADPPSVIKARQVHIDNIQQWIKQTKSPI